MDIENSIVWITGASSGIGEALAVEMAARKARLILSARREEQLERVQARCLSSTSNVQILPLDVTKPETFPAAVETVESHYGGLDILVNNAGLGQRGGAAETAPEVDRRIMEVNFFGPMALTRAALPLMRSRGRGQIVVTSSVFGKFGGPGRSAYAASKHALHGWFDSLRAESKDLVVTLICPGYIRTEISQHALEADGQAHNQLDAGQARGISPEDCARYMVEAIRKGKSEAVIGGWKESWAVRLKRFLPFVFERVIRRVSVN